MQVEYWSKNLLNKLRGVVQRSIYWLLTTDPEQLLRDCWRLYFEASDFEAFCNAKWWILFGGTPALKNISLRVRN